MGISFAEPIKRAISYTDMIALTFGPLQRLYGVVGRIDSVNSASVCGTDEEKTRKR